MIVAFALAGLIALAFVALDDSNLLPLLFIFTLTFFQGTLEMAFGVPSIVTRGLAEVGILFLFMKAAYGKWIRDGEPLRTVGLPWAVLLLAVCIGSFLLNGTAWIPFLLFVRHAFMFYLLFIALLNLDWSAETGARVNRALIVLFLVQLPAAVEKLFRRGIDEGGGIGTMSSQGGELSTMMPLFVLAFLTAFYLYRPRMRYVLLILAYIAFGVLNSKRALVFLVPFVLLFVFAMFRARERPWRGASRLGITWSIPRVLAVFSLVTILAVYGAVRMIFTLNPEGAVGGSFDPGYLWRFIAQYEMRVFQLGMTFGRIATTVHTTRLLDDAGALGAFLGFGPGVLIESQYLVEGTTARHFLKYGIVAGRTGFVWWAIQIGYMGVISLVLLYAAVYRRVAEAYRASVDRDDRVLALGVVGASFVFLLDFVMYGTSTLLLGVLTPTYFYLAAYCLRHLSSTTDHRRRQTLRFTAELTHCRA